MDDFENKDLNGGESQWKVPSFPEEEPSAAGEYAPEPENAASPEDVPQEDAPREDVLQ